MVPGRRFSTMTSAFWTSSRKSSLPSGALRFIASERLFRLSLMKGDDSPSRKGSESRAMSVRLGTDAPLDATLLEALRRFDSPTLSNAIGTFAVRRRDEGYMSMDIRCMCPELGRLVGYAATATIRARGRPPHGDQSAL